jgi:hypothetical protein
MNLKDQLIELGKDNEKLQPALRKIIDDLPKEETPKLDAIEPVLKPEPSIPLNPTPKSEKGQFFTLSPNAFKAFNNVILPQIQAQLDATDFQDISQMVDEMEGLGRAKNVELENSLIVFKPISMSSQRFYKEIQSVFHNWLRPKLKKDDSE